MDLDRVALDLSLPAIKAFLEGRFAEDRAGMFDQGLKDGEFPAREGDIGAVPRAAHRRRVEFEAIPFDHARGAAFLPAQHGAQPGGQFRKVEGLAQVVVRAGIKSGYPVAHLIACRQQKDGNPRRCRPQLRQQFQTRAVGQHDVQHHARESPARQRGAGVGQGADGIGGEARQGQSDAEAVGQDRVVLDNQQAHGVFSLDP